MNQKLLQCPFEETARCVDAGGSCSDRQLPPKQWMTMTSNTDISTSLLNSVAEEVLLLLLYVCIEPPTKDAVWMMSVTIAIVGFLALCVVVVSVTVVVVVLRKHRHTTTPGNIRLP